MWNSTVNEPKTNRSKAPIPVVKQLANALNAHKLRMGKLAIGPIFQAGNGKTLNLDNLARRVIAPVAKWHGWHSFRTSDGMTSHEAGVEQLGDMLVVNMMPGCEYHSAKDEWGRSMKCSFCAYGRFGPRSAALGQVPPRPRGSLPGRRSDR